MGVGKYNAFVYLSVSTSPIPLFSGHAFVCLCIPLYLLVLVCLSVCLSLCLSPQAHSRSIVFRF